MILYPLSKYVSRGTPGIYVLILAVLLAPALIVSWTGQPFPSALGVVALLGCAAVMVEGMSVLTLSYRAARLHLRECRRSERELDLRQGKLDPTTTTEGTR